MPQNIYDDPDFFANYRELRKAGESAGEVFPSLAIADLSAMLPPLRGAEVLDIGCGDGWFSRWATRQGAAGTHGLDLSHSQIKLARETAAAMEGAPENKMTFEVADLETVALPSDTYDFAFSSLALHYVADLPRLARAVHGALRPGGSLYFIVEHPIFTAPARREVCTGGAADGVPPHWPLAGYLQEGPRRHWWLGHDVEKRHYPVSGYVNALLGAGFELVHMREWGRPGDGRFGGVAVWMTADIGPTFLTLGGRKKVGEER